MQAIKGKLRVEVVRDDNDPAKPIVEVHLSEWPRIGLARLTYWPHPEETDAALKELVKLSALKELRKLDLSQTLVTCAGLKELATLKGLQTLVLSGTQVTDAGLKELAPLKGLRTLDLCGTRVTDAGVAKLEEALPECRITREIGWLGRVQE